MVKDFVLQFLEYPSYHMVVFYWCFYKGISHFLWFLHWSIQMKTSQHDVHCYNFSDLASIYLTIIKPVSSYVSSYHILCVTEDIWRLLFCISLSSYVSSYL
jgi:hypothetical protein